MKSSYKSSLAIRTKSPGIARVWIYDSFCANTQLVEACVFNLSQMGELVGKLDEAFIEAHSDVPWRAMRGLRNRIVHDYDGVNLRLVWDVIAGDLPDLKTMLTSL